jgi:hypothetical protein
MRTANRRAAERKRSFKGARISNPELGISVSCAVRDISAHGARLMLLSPVTFTNAFDLTLSDGVVKKCKVAWHSGNSIGVSFA